MEDCPLKYTSRNAPLKRDVLGTILLAVLARHWRYAHISALRGDGVNPGLLGRTKVASEDGAAGIRNAASGVWLKTHLRASYEALLVEPWSPQNPGRPSHSYHTYFIANLRLVMDVEAQTGNQSASSFAQPELWALLDGLPKARCPRFVRGDCNWGPTGQWRDANSASSRTCSN